MQKIKYCIIKFGNDYFAIRNTQIIDILEGFNDKFITLFSTNKNVRLFYKNQQLRIIDSFRIFINTACENTKISSILVIRNPLHKEIDLCGFPIQEIVGYAFFDGLLLSAVDILNTKAFCSCSVEHENKKINMLDMRKIINMNERSNIANPLYTAQPCYNMGREN